MFVFHKRKAAKKQCQTESQSVTGSRNVFCSVSHTETGVSLVSASLQEHLGLQNGFVSLLYSLLELISPSDQTPLWSFHSAFGKYEKYQNSPLTGIGDVSYDISLSVFLQRRTSETEIASPDAKL